VGSQRADQDKDGVPPIDAHRLSLQNLLPRGCADAQQDNGRIKDEEGGTHRPQKQLWFFHANLPIG
jgi:hypothetical protein